MNPLHTQSRAELFQARLVRFGAAACLVARDLRRDFVGSHVAHQLIRAATSPAASYAEARDAESRQAFIHKLKLCIKELRETSVWLEIGEELGSQSAAVAEARRECDELIAILVRSVKTARSNSKRPSIR
jgi:four helix bundle protein